MPEYVAWLDGAPAVGVELTDSVVLRGDGVFEAVRSYGGRLFRLGDHLDRLEQSARSLRLDVPDRAVLTGWLGDAAARGGDCVVRVVLTRGSTVPGIPGDPRCIVVSHPVPVVPSALRLLPVSAPWHPAGRAWELAGAKTVSYAANLAATRLAVDAGRDDALLVSDAGAVLEGPTFSIGWVRGGVVLMPPLELGLLDSVTRRVVCEVAEVRTECLTLGGMAGVDEVFAMSTIKEVCPVIAVGATPYQEGPVVGDLAQRFASVTTADDGH